MKTRNIKRKANYPYTNGNELEKLPKKAHTIVINIVALKNGFQLLEFLMRSCMDTVY